MFSRLQSVPSGPQYKEKDPSPAKKNIKKVILTLSTNCVIMACDQCQQNEKDSLVAVTSHFPNMANQPTEQLIYRKNFPRSQNINSLQIINNVFRNHYDWPFYMYKSRILSIKTLCVVVNLLFVCETWQSGWKKLVSESGEGETRKLWISFNSLPQSLHLIRTKTCRFSVLKILENIWGGYVSFQRTPSMVWSKMFLECFMFVLLGI